MPAPSPPPDYPLRISRTRPTEPFFAFAAFAPRWTAFSAPHRNIDLTKCDIDLMDLHAIDLERAGVDTLALGLGSVGQLRCGAAGAASRKTARLGSRGSFQRAIRPSHLAYGDGRAKSPTGWLIEERSCPGVFPIFWGAADFGQSPKVARSLAPAASRSAPVTFASTKSESQSLLSTRGTRISHEPNGNKRAAWERRGRRKRTHHSKPGPRHPPTRQAHVPARIFPERRRHGNQSPTRGAPVDARTAGRPHAGGSAKKKHPHGDRRLSR
jgi:hypothetical protein